MLDPERVAEIEGKPVVDSDGTDIGTVADVYLNSSDDRPAWVAVETEDTRVLAPLDGARYEDETLVVDHPADLVLDAPAAVGDGGVLAPEEEHALYAHYGLHDSALREDTGRPANLDATP